MARVDPSLRPADPSPAPRPVARLLPGVEPYRRDAHHLQVGMDSRAVVVPDTPEVRQALETGVVGSGAPTSALLALTRVRRAGLLVDDELARRCLTAYADGPASRAAVMAGLCESPSEAAERWERRSRGRALVEGAPGDRAALSRLLDPAGARGVVTDRTTGQQKDAEVPDPAAVVLVIRDREPDRDTVDALQHRGEVHLVVRSDLDQVVVGPFVVPGRTACLRCLDAHLADRDPRRPLVLEQHTRSEATFPRDPVLHQLALAWAARDLLRWWDGLEPSTWSATVRIGPDLEPRREAWLRHPHCGCGWDALPAQEAHQYSESSLPSIDRRCSREHVSQ